MKPLLKATIQEYDGELLFEVNAQGDLADARATLEKAISIIEDRMHVHVAGEALQEKAEPEFGTTIVRIIREEVKKEVAQTLKSAGERVWKI